MFTLTTTFESANELIDFIRPHTVSEVQVAPATPVIPHELYADKFPAIIDMLNDQRFTLRKVSTILEEANISSEEILFDTLRYYGIDIVIKRMNQGHEKLIGLRSHN